MNIAQAELDMVAEYAFRYAIDRRLCANVDVANFLIRHRDELTPTVRKRISQEIERAVSERRADDAREVASWNEARNELTSAERSRSALLDEVSP